MRDETVRSWLDARTPRAPTELRSLLDDDLAGTGPLPERLAEAALRRLGAALEHPGERPAAFELLAADAHLTYACEAAVDREPRAGAGEDEGADIEARLRSVLRRLVDPTA